MKKKALLFGGLVVIGLGSGVANWWHNTHTSATNDNALVVYGNVDIREVRLAFNGSEHVGEILVDEGDQVNAGQLLARLHTERLKAALQRARAEVVALKAESNSAALSFKRVKSMAERKLASSEEMDLAVARSQAANAHVVAAEAAVVESEQAFKDAQLFAPVNGVIRDRIVEPGDFVTPQTPVLTLAVLDPVWVRTYIPETFLGRVKPGMHATIMTDSYTNKLYQGWVGSISPTAEFTPKSVETPELRTRLVYQARVFVCNPQLELRLGMPVTVHIDLNSTSTANSAESRCTPSSPQLGK